MYRETERMDRETERTDIKKERDREIVNERARERHT